jgi:D-alanyl-D-alanine carboxypeptidase (penicillin-binding protein 5/6)
LNYGFDNFDYYMAVEQDDQIGFVPVTRSKTKEIEIMYAESLKIPMSLEEKEKLNIFIDMPQEVKAPVDRGQVIGEARVCIEDGVVYKHIPLVSNGEASRHDLKTSMEKIINSWLELGSNIEVNTKLPEF